MGRIRGRSRSVAGRMAVASLTVLGAGVVGMVTAPMAFGQLVIGGGGQSATTTNSGSAGANSGGNTSVGNGSTNVATATSSLLGAVTAPLGLGGPTNNSTGTSSVTTGPATATGNTSETATGQSNASGNQVNSFLAGQSQNAGVNNIGGAQANSGGNTSVGNASQNTATITQNASGGLVGLAVNLGSPTNNSTGTSNITTGPATATGNESSTNIGQGTGGGAGAPCNSARFSPFGGGQNAGVANRGAAQANSGRNTSVGNASTNEASTNVTSTDQTAVGGVLGLTLNLAGPVNNSTGTSNIATGPATAVGNSSETSIGQGCGEVATLSAGRPSVVAAPHGRIQQARVALARTGLDTGDLGMIAGVSLAAGLLLIASQRRRMAARQAVVPMAGFGLGLGAEDWDRVASRR